MVSNSQQIFLKGEKPWVSFSCFINLIALLCKEK